MAGSVSITGCGNEVPESSRSTRRIIAVAPNVVETLFELGLGGRVVAVGDHCAWPPEVSEKPRIGGLLDPRLELIASLEPDLAILLPSEHALATALGRLGVEVLVTPVETVQDVEQAIAAIAARAEVEERGSVLVERLRRELAPQPVGKGAPVLMVVGREPGNLSDIYAAAAGTFLHELLERLDGVNVLAQSPLRYPQIGLEEISVRRPRVIIELQPKALSKATRADLIADWHRDLPGSRPCVVTIEGDHVLVPGPRIGALYRDLADALRECADV
jgi:ABC-type Fe3+-hydroxamate transport system substrate-binding protein